MACFWKCCCSTSKWGRIDYRSVTEFITINSPHWRLSTLMGFMKNSNQAKSMIKENISENSGNHLFGRELQSVCLYQQKPPKNWNNYFLWYFKKNVNKPFSKHHPLHVSTITGGTKQQFQNKKRMIATGLSSTWRI